MGYNKTTGKIEGPEVSIADVQKALPSRQSGIIALCRSDRINVFAKYKPFNLNTLFFISKEQHDQARYTKFYGTRLKQNAGRKDPSEYVDADTGVWEHEKPENAFRLLDFEGYNPKAESPIKDISKTWGGDVNVRVAQFNLHGNQFFAVGDNVELPLNIMNAYDESYYFGLLFVKRTNPNVQAGTEVMMMTVPVTLGQAIANPSLLDKNFLVEQLGYSKGDVVDVYLCCSLTCTTSPDGQGGWETETFVKPKPADYVTLLHPSNNSGHAVWRIIGWSMWDLHYDCSRMGVEIPVYNGSDFNEANIAFTFTDAGDGQRTNLSRIALHLRNTHNWQGEAVVVKFTAEVSNEMYSVNTVTLNRGNAQDTFDVVFAGNMNLDMNVRNLVKVKMEVMSGTEQAPIPTGTSRYFWVEGFVTRKDGGNTTWLVNNIIG